MHLFYLFFILTFLVISSEAFGHTLIITGKSHQNSAKSNLLAKYITNGGDFINKVENSKHSISILLKDDLELLMEPNKENIDVNVPMNPKLAAIVYVADEFDKLNNREWEMLNFFLRTNRKFILVDFNKDDNISEYLSQVAKCETTSRANVKDDNIAYICNDKKDYKHIEHISVNNIRIKQKVQILPKSSSIFAEAAKTTKPRVEMDELEDEIQDIVEKTMKKVKRGKGNKHNNDDDDDDDEDERNINHAHKQVNRLDCKYRKSCYETGKKVTIESSDFLFSQIFNWDSPSSPRRLSKTEDADQDGIPDSEDDDVSLADRKRVCKYRTACYKEHNIPLTDRQKEVERSFMSSKLQVPTGKKRTLKDIAQKTVSGVEEREDKAKSRPPTKSMIVEKKLQEIEDQLRKKVDCKYRKSCYNTGILPEIEESSYSIPLISNMLYSSEINDDNQKDEQTFDEMEDLQRKHYCKYRKSCYETGKKPEIDPEIHIASLQDIIEVADKVETRKLTLQERCKYRKSCYETGILPDLSIDEQYIEKVANKEISSVVPASVQDLKTLCKYRKSCYKEVAVAPSSDTITSIRRRRIIEKEVRKRRTRRHRRLSRRRVIISHYDTTFRRVNKEPVEKTQHEIKMEEEAKEKRKHENSPRKSNKIQGKKTESVGKVKKQENEEESNEEVVAQKIVEVNTERIPKKSKRFAKESGLNDEDQEEKPKKVSSRSLKKKKKEPEHVAEVHETEEEEQLEIIAPIVAGKAKKSSKKLMEEKEENDIEARQGEKNKEEKVEEDEKVEEVHKNSKLKEMDFDDENDFEKLDRSTKLNCKYRTSCYKSGNVEGIAPADFSIGQIAYLWTASPSSTNQKGVRDSDGDGIPDHEDKNSKLSDRKLSCKYRPSCYVIHDIPISEDILKREEKRSSETPEVKLQHSSETNEDDNDDATPLRAADAKLGCKYRKSCYSSGVIPTIRAWNNAPTLVEAIEINDRNAKMDKCKYRKSCYEKVGIIDKRDEEDIAVKEEERKPQLKEPTAQRKEIKETKNEGRHQKQEQKRHGRKEKKHQQESEEEDNDDDDDDEQDDKLREPKGTKIVKEVVMQTDVNDKETTNEREVHLNVEEKNICKYRKSCYLSIEPKAMRQDHSGSMARRAGSGQKCHIYYLSCREAMGLPPKEKAPIGPNGKRLCRKIKKTA